MTLPHLWKKVTLRSYEHFRYNDNLPEGFGSASPFSLGLNALVTHNVNNLVKSLSLVGDWTAADLAQCSKVGRLSESAMILNIALRAAIDRCTQLESFEYGAPMYGGIIADQDLDGTWERSFYPML